MTQCNDWIGLRLYVFDSPLDEFRPATDEEIDAATNLSTHAQDAVSYRAALVKIAERRPSDVRDGDNPALSAWEANAVASAALAAALPGLDMGRAMPEGYRAPRCESCGHTAGEHATGAGWPHKPTRGICFVTSCDCREFVEATPGAVTSEKEN